MIVKINELSGILGITVRQINKLAKEGIIPRARRGEYELAGAVQAYIEHIKHGDPDRKSSLYTQEIRLKAIQSKKLEIEVAKLLGRLIPIETMQKILERHVTAARTNFLLIENEIPRVKASKDLNEAKEIFRKAAYAILGQLAKAGDEISIGRDEEGDWDDIATMEPASHPDYQRVGRTKHVAKPRRQQRARQVSPRSRPISK